MTETPRRKIPIVLAALAVSAAPALANDSTAELGAGGLQLVRWSGPIGSFLLVVDKGDPDALVSFCGTGVKKISPTQFEMTATEFVPDRDLEILIAAPPKGQ